MPTSPSVSEISPADLKLQLDSPQPPVVLDVREPWELEAARLPGTLDIPMAQVPQRLNELPRDRPIVVMCHAGARSMKVANFLAQNGFAQVTSLEGGIRAWAEDVDPSVGTY
ncbi:MAG TPA: rhodanese-like domain-containing protein [Steroidobacteraceae bacterium]|jgi:rhodanese-related sulfurtransferase